MFKKNCLIILVVFFLIFYFENSFAIDLCDSSQLDFLRCDSTNSSIEKCSFIVGDYYWLGVSSCSSLSCFQCNSALAACDMDLDGYGNWISPGIGRCTDCNDSNASINPNATEWTTATCTDGVDNNCNGDLNSTWDNSGATGVDCLDINCSVVVSVTKPANGTTYNFLQLLLNFSASSTLGIQTYWFNNGSANTTYTSPAFWNTTYWLNNYIFYANNSAGCVNSSLKSFFTLNCTDYDNDGYGGAGGNCTLPLDCNDNNASIYQNLYGFLDSDGDAYTTGPNTTICSGASLPSNYRVANTTTDCNDANSSLYQNISGYVDADADGYGGGSALNVCSGASLPSGYSAVGGDCNDASASISPAVTEACSDNVDNDCDGSIDEGCSSSTASSSCFISGTKIKMADGADKNIEDVKTGEFVSSFDEDFKFTSSQVLELESPIREGYYLIEFEDGSSLKLTEEHPIWIGKK